MSVSMGPHSHHCESPSGHVVLTQKANVGIQARAKELCKCTKDRCLIRYLRRFYLTGLNPRVLMLQIEVA